ncbi:unnamed protein product [marine sediment metagenome]|uniref:Thiolase-like protein type 1 additional C-terminal domain-containing protein n=1 Tax=marine sediment metagenome TaxID=412755 RepID=X0Z0P8_9ZZZZ
MHCSFPDPHHPVCPPGKYREMYKPEEIEISSTLNEIHKLYNHEILKNYTNIYRRSRLRETNEEASGHLTIKAYTIYYERNGKPKRGIVIGHLGDRRRTLARIEDDPERLQELEKQELIGRTFKVHFDNESGVNLISLNEELN